MGSLQEYTVPLDTVISFTTLHSNEEILDAQVLSHMLTCEKPEDTFF